jgi:nucleotide-binding universal stress UspA family protein
MTVQQQHEANDAPSAALTRLLVAISSQEEARVLVPWTRELAHALSLPVTIAYVLDPAHQRESVEVAEAMALDFLALLSRDVRLVDLEVETRLLVGLRQEELPEMAAQSTGTLLMVPSGERSGIAPAFLGGGREGILRAIATPFVVIPPGTPAPDRIRRVIAGDDRSDVAPAVLDAARQIAATVGVPSIAVEVIAPESLPAHQFVAVEPEFATDRIVMRGRPAPTLLATARAMAASLIVVGSHGAGGLTKRLLGSTSDWLARHADRPILIVPDSRRGAGG